MRREHILKLTLWFVFRLSTCFRNTSVHRSLQMNLITSSVSLKRGLSRENLHIHQASNQLVHLFLCSRMMAEETYRSTSPCPTRYPSVSSL